MIKYGIYSGVSQYISNNVGNIRGSSFIPVKVIDIILDENHPDWEKYGGWDSLGLIKFVPFYTSLTEETISMDIARPLFPNIKNYPLLQEVTFIISLPNPDSVNNINVSSYYYFNSINIWNHPHQNALPNTNNVENEDKKLTYQEITSGLNKTDNTDVDTSLILGDTFKEKSYIRPLLPFEGDIIYEGRFGQSIRFGSVVNNKNPWSKNNNNEGSPITIIRNGQLIKNNEKGWIPIVEDINEDASSIYLCDGQVIPIILSSNNFKSFEFEENDFILTKLTDNPT